VVLQLDEATGQVRRRYRIERPGGWTLETNDTDNSVIIGNLEGGAVTLLRPNGAQSSLAGSVGEIDAAATPDGRQIWSVNFQTSELTIFDPAHRRMISKQVIGQQASRIRFTPDRRAAIIVTSGDSSVHKFNLQTGQRSNPCKCPQVRKSLRSVQMVAALMSHTPTAMLSP
jgi:hypothetical protein